VGVGVGGALLLSGAFFFFWRRRRNRRSESQASQAALSAAGDQGDYYPRKPDQPDQPYEMESTTTGDQTTVRSGYNDHNVVEAPNDTMVGELPAHRETESPVELPAERV
jgi:LPXTG-motif cell wall-anchored protein